MGPTPQEDSLFVEQASCLFVTEVQALSSIAAYLNSQFSSIARPVTNPLESSPIPGGESGGMGHGAWGRQAWELGIGHWSLGSGH